MKCAKCSREITACEECSGTGTIDGETCEVCDGTKQGCPIHHADWQSTAIH